MKRGDMRILWMSNAPFVPTGYGTVTKNVCYRLLQRGYNVATINFYGHEGVVLELNGLKQYPKAFDLLGKDAAELAIADFNPDVFITLFDCWVGHEWLDRLHSCWCPYTPVDHYPIPPPVERIARKAYAVISMSKYGETQLNNVGISNVYIPHGVDTKTFYPMEDKTTCKTWTGMLSRQDKFSKHVGAKDFGADSFVVGVNAANKGPRKDFPRMMTAFKLFLEQNPDAKKDARLYFHTWIRGVMQGYHLDDLGKEMGLLEHMRWTPIIKMHCGLAEQQLNVVYNSFDVFLNLAQGEGFGLPLIEAQACGVPCIATNFTSMTELVKGHGWLIPIKDLHYSPLNAQYAFADEWKTAEAIAHAYNHPRTLKKHARNSHLFASAFYDYERCILPLWSDFLDSILVDRMTVCELKT